MRARINLYFRLVSIHLHVHVLHVNISTQQLPRSKNIYSQSHFKQIIMSSYLGTYALQYLAWYTYRTRFCITTVFINIRYVP